jgi:uncharacterized protein (TIGR00725 family)
MPLTERVYYALRGSSEQISAGRRRKMTSMVQKPTVGVMGSANDVLTDQERERLTEIAARLGSVIAARGCTLITGATTGLPDMVSRSARSAGGLTVGISPAINRKEHVNRYGLPDDGAEVIIYTGFGLKGRNVVNIRSSDIVIIFGGGMGALNEFTIAYDEGKVIGVLEGSGGVADHIKEVIGHAKKETLSRMIYGREPEELIDSCLGALAEGGKTF